MSSSFFSDSEPVPVLFDLDPKFIVVCLNFAIFLGGGKEAMSIGSYCVVNSSDDAIC